MCAVLVFASCKKDPIDEAKAAGKSTADFPQITADVFKPMDGGVGSELSPEEALQPASDNSTRGLHFICLNANTVTGNFTIPGDATLRRPLHDLPQFVTIRGGAYFFLPSLRALRYFARA